MKQDADERELTILLEAARRANWDALHGPMHLRSGKFRPEGDRPDVRRFKAEEPESDVELNHRDPKVSLAG